MMKRFRGRAALCAGRDRFVTTTRPPSHASRCVDVGSPARGRSKPVRPARVIVTAFAVGREDLVPPDQRICSAAVRRVICITASSDRAGQGCGEIQLGRLLLRPGNATDD